MEVQRLTAEWRIKSREIMEAKSLEAELRQEAKLWQEAKLRKKAELQRPKVDTMEER